MILQQGDQIIVRVMTLGQHDEGLDDRAAFGVSRADHCAFQHRIMQHEGLLHFRAGNIIARRDDQIIGARDIPEIAVFIAAIEIAGDVPALLHIGFLALVVEIEAACGPFDGQPSDLAIGHSVSRLIHDPGLIAGHRPAGGAGPDIGTGR